MPAANRSPLVAPPSARFTFGPWLLDSATRELRKDGQPHKLGARAFELLLALVERAGEVLTHDQLFERAWPGRVVIDDNLKVQVMALRRLLGADAIVTAPGRGYRFAWPVQPLAPGADAPAAPAGFIGRSAELAHLRETLMPGCWITITGPGGMGKTRLAQAAVAQVAARFADGAITLELAAVADARHLPRALAAALQLPPAADDEAALRSAIATMELLLVLDNCEHLAAEVLGWVERLRASAPRLALLVTSQVALGSAQESLLPLAGLDAGDDALALFTARVAARSPGFAIDGASREAAVSLCRQLAGLPLAIELAAARVPLLGVEGVLAKLGQPLALLAGGPAAAPQRQRSLRDAILWSHALLDEPARVVFRRLGVFADGFTIELAQAVAGDPSLGDWGLLEQLQLLHSKSLLQVEGSGAQPRYRLLPHARGFAREQAQAAGEWPALRQRHLLAVTERFDAADRRLAATPLAAWVEELLPDLPELRAAFETAFDDDRPWPAAVALAGAAGCFWAHAGLDSDAREVLRRLMPLVSADAARLPVEHRQAFWFAVANRHLDPAFSWAETFEAITRALELARLIGEPRRIHRCLGLWAPLGQRLHRPVDFAASVAEMRALEGSDWSVLERSGRRRLETRVLHVAGDWDGVAAHERIEYRLLTEAGDLQRSWTAAHSVALADIACGRAPQALALMREVAAQIREQGLQRRCWVQMAMFAMTLIDAEQATDAAWPELARLMRQVGGFGWMPMHWPDAVAQRGQLDNAARLLGWAERRCAERNEKPSAHGDKARERLRRRLEQTFEAQRRAALLGEGRMLDDDQAAALILAA